jgi:hypothetical protein
MIPALQALLGRFNAFRADYTDGRADAITAYLDDNLNTKALASSALSTAKWDSAKAAALSGFGGGSRFLTSVRDMPMMIALATNLHDKTTIDSGSSTFFTGHVASNGSQAQLVAANTYATIANLTATKPGVLSALIGPSYGGGVSTTSIKVTIDGGAAVEMVFTNHPSGTRVLIGQFIGPTGAVEWDAGTYAKIGAAFDISAINTDFKCGTCGQHRKYPNILHFTTSLLVEMKNSVSTNSYCGVIYSED